MSPPFSQEFRAGIKEPPWTKGSQFRATLQHNTTIELILRNALNSVTMHPIFYLALLAGSSCLAHYRGFDSNLVERDEPQEIESDLVECPVCEDLSWLPNNESCNILRGNKLYKRCALGIYNNNVCGNRRDCYRGPGEQCTEKMEVDVYGQRCGHGLYCNRALGKCTGLSYTVDSNVQYMINPLRYPLRARREI